MPSRRRFYKRPAWREYKKMYVIATDGKETEPQYFNAIKERNSEAVIKILKGKIGKNAPKVVLSRAMEFKNKKKLRNLDEVWLILDRNTLPVEQLNWLSKVCCENGFFLGVSNPCFEFWLLSHFEKPKSGRVDTATKCRHRLLNYLPNYSKNHVEAEKLLPRTQTAINNAKQCTSENEAWPSDTGTYVYKLVEKII